MCYPNSSSVGVFLFLFYVMYKKQHKIIFIFSFILLFVFLGIQKEFLFVQPVLETTKNLETQISNISVTIIADDANFHLSFNEGMSLYEALYEAREKNQITFLGRQYSGLGFFITNIGSLHQIRGKNLMYDINGKEAQVGISSYLPQNGDIINWKLK